MAVMQAEQRDTVSPRGLPIMLKGFRAQNDTIFLSSGDVIQQFLSFKYYARWPKFVFKIT